jgi:uncharacterized protein YabE (DUF348 family)
MRLYHSSIQQIFYIVILLIFLTACASPAATQELITVKLNIDGSTQGVKLPVGSTAQRFGTRRNYAGIPGSGRTGTIHNFTEQGEYPGCMRVEEFVVEEKIPFERRMLQTESLAEADTLLMQSGVNGKEEITYRIVYEDGVEFPNTRYARRSSRKQNQKS